MANFILYSKKIHRLFMWLVLVFGTVLGITGIMLKFGIGDFTIRQIHSNISLFFSASFITMAITGLILYFTPALVRFFQKR